MSPDRDDRTLELAGRVAELLRTVGMESAVIGGVALAAHGYPRATRDLDLGAATPRLALLHAAKAALEAEGLSVELRGPSPDDALGGRSPRASTWTRGWSSSSGGSAASTGSDPA